MGRKSPTLVGKNKFLPLSQGLSQLRALTESSKNEKALNATEFQKKVWGACCCVPSGKVSTYGALAKFVGSPQSSRAVGQALSVNPFAPTVPCHRVVGSNRFLTGFGGERFHQGGVESKKKVQRLEAEGVKIDKKTGKVLTEYMI